VEFFKGIDRNGGQKMRSFPIPTLADIDSGVSVLPTRQELDDEIFEHQLAVIKLEQVKTRFYAGDRKKPLTHKQFFGKVTP